MNDKTILEQLKLDAKDALILKKLCEIEKKLEQKVAFLTVEDAVELYWKYLQTKKKPRGYKYLIDEFLKGFVGRNIAEITAEDMEEFMLTRWSDSKNNTIRTRHAQLNGLFNHAIKILKKKGSPTFHNPMSLISIPASEYKTVEFLPPEQIKRIIHAPHLEHYRLIMALLVTTGMRCDDLLKLRVKDKEGPVLTLWNPKSGNTKEWVVVPEKVESWLNAYIHKMRLRPEDPICPVSYSTIYEDIVVKYTSKSGTLFTPHYFRKWISTFWNRQGDQDMVAAVLRHRSSQAGEKLKRIYIAPLSVEEVIEKQKVLEKVLF